MHGYHKLTCTLALLQIFKVFKSARKINKEYNDELESYRVRVVKSETADGKGPPP